VLALTQREGEVVLSSCCRNWLALHREWVLAASDITMQISMNSWCFVGSLFVSCWGFPRGVHFQDSKHWRISTVSGIKINTSRFVWSSAIQIQNVCRLSVWADSWCFKSFSHVCNSSLSTGEEWWSEVLCIFHLLLLHHHNNGLNLQAPFKKAACCSLHPSFWTWYFCPLSWFVNKKASTSWIWILPLVSFTFLSHVRAQCSSFRSLYVDIGQHGGHWRTHGPGVPLSSKTVTDCKW